MCVFWDLQGYFVVQKLLLNAGIKGFWYTEFFWAL